MEVELIGISFDREVGEIALSVLPRREDDDLHVNQDHDMNRRACRRRREGDERIRLDGHSVQQCAVFVRNHLFR